MLPNFRSRIRLRSGNNPFICSMFKPSRSSPLSIISLSQTLTLAMVTLSAPDTRRPTCPSCSRPTRLCLCTRLKTPILENSIAITVLQHSLEKKHPLNSTRIATLGLKNLKLAWVSDVLSEAHFDIHLFQSNLELGTDDSVQNHKNTEAFQPDDISLGFLQSNLQQGTDDSGENDKKAESFQSSDFSLGFLQSNLELGIDDSGEIHKKAESFQSADINLGFLPSNHELGTDDSVDNHQKTEFFQSADISLGFLQSNLELGSDDSVENHKKTEPFHVQPAAISFTIERRGAITSLRHIWNENPNFNELLANRAAIDRLRNGFMVKKMQRSSDQNDHNYVEEFELVVPPGSVLLFPSEDSIGFDEVDFEVKNLIVLDGTWGKATKMYKENPWLKFLPHLKLDIEKLSLYGEVRRQPKAGCLSSIESIVYALKGVGEDLEGLDGLLDVFESMVVDQRRCKNERLSNIASV